MKLRSVCGQLALIGSLFVGALGLALVALAVRGVFFEKFTRERCPAPAEELLAAAEGRPGARALVAADAGPVYGLWLERPDLDGLATWLAEIDRAGTATRALRTLALGDRTQRLRAAELLGRVRTDESMAPLRAARARALRRGEADVAAACAATLGE